MEWTVETKDVRVEQGLKLAQAAWFFVQEGKRKGKLLSCEALSNLIYWVERTAYKEYGSPMFYDDIEFTKKGARLKGVWELLRGTETSERQEVWSRVIRTHGHKVSEEKSCEYTSIKDLMTLSEADVELLGKVWRVWSVQRGRKRLRKKECKEWSWSGSKGNRIVTTCEMLRGMGFSTENVVHFLQTVARDNYIAASFSKSSEIKNQQVRQAPLKSCCKIGQGF